MMQTPSTLITLIIPVYNPQDGWEKILVVRYREFCQQIGFDAPMLVVNDGSSLDITISSDEVVRQLGSDKVKIIYYRPNRGKGGALKAGASLVTTPFTMFTDVDFPYSVQSMLRVFKAVQDHGGIIAGNRESNYYESLSDFRTRLSKGLRLLNKAILGLPVNDTQCGLKAFDSTGKDILLSCKTERFLIDLELLLAANAQKIAITPVHVELRPDVSFTKFNPTVLLKEVANFAKLLWKYRVQGK